MDRESFSARAQKVLSAAQLCAHFKFWKFVNQHQDRA